MRTGNKGYNVSGLPERIQPMKRTPAISIPSPHYGAEPGTWAHKTVSTRFSNTALRILEENELSSLIQDRVRRLVFEIPNSPIRQIEDPGAPDLEYWDGYTAPYLGQDWYRPPWWFTEHYFYRRILEATRYFQDGDGGGADPFHYQKRKGVEVSRDAIRQLGARIENWLADNPRAPMVIENLLYLDLWGNQADLSLWPAEGDGKPDHTDLQQAVSHILVNHAQRVAEDLLANAPHHRVDILIDNAGFELVGDLGFADFLLSSGITKEVRLHLKKHPTYVSDAMEKDVLATIAALETDEIHAPTRRLGTRLFRAYEGSKLQLKSNWFWTSPLDGWAMPDLLYDELAGSSLVISKGDANYRRLLGDRHWISTTRFEDILSYYPAPLAALRTLKSELVVGLKNGQDREVEALDPEWLIDGRWGVIQYTHS